MLKPEAENRPAPGKNPGGKNLLPAQQPWPECFT
jgi:hypothetical protein